MMSVATLPLIAAIFSTPVQAGSFAEVKIGEPAPGFELPDLSGETVKLSDHKGKVVVLEWFNPGCPFVKRAHEDGGALQTMAATWSEKGVVWLAINSGSPGKQGTGVETNAAAAQSWSMSHPVLLDEDGKVGRVYAAKTTPQMVVIDEAGNQQYNGALDNAPFGKVKGKDKTLTPFAAEVIAAVVEGKESPHKRTKPYGCSVKY